MSRHLTLLVLVLGHKLIIGKGFLITDTPRGQFGRIASLGLFPAQDTADLRAFSLFHRSRFSLLTIGISSLAQSTMQVSTYPSNHELLPTEHDVLLGRGRGNESHAGNARYLMLLDEHSEAYNKAVRRFKKSDVTETVIRRVNEKGRFVKHEKGQWVECSPEEVHCKVSQALRYRGRKAERDKTKKPSGPTSQYKTPRVSPSSSKRDLSAADLVPYPDQPKRANMAMAAPVTNDSLLSALCSSRDFMGIYANAVPSKQAAANQGDFTKVLPSTQMTLNEGITTQQGGLSPSRHMNFMDAPRLVTPIVARGAFGAMERYGETLPGPSVPSWTQMNGNKGVDLAMKPTNYAMPSSSTTYMPQGYNMETEQYAADDYALDFPSAEGGFDNNFISDAEIFHFLHSEQV